MIRLSQAGPAVGGLASVPSSDPNLSNIPLAQGGDGSAVPAAGASGATGSPAMSGAVTPEEMLGVLQRIISSGPSGASQYEQSVQNLLHRSKDPQIQNSLSALANAITMQANPKQRTKNPSTGELDPTAVEIAQKLKDKVTQMQQAAKQQGQTANDTAAPTGQSPQAPSLATQPSASPRSASRRYSASDVLFVRVAREIVLAEGQGVDISRDGVRQYICAMVSAMKRTAQLALTPAPPAVNNFAAPAKKKKKKGNPFRVLMGAVGKLLDHGLEKGEIVRQLKKKMDYFPEDTIADCVDTVKEYNRNKNREDLDQEDSAGAQLLDKESEKAAATRSSLPLVVAGGAVYNHYREAQEKKLGGIYDIAPDFDKRSTTELFARLRWLESLMAYGKDTKQGDSRVADDKSGAAAQIRAIKSALTKRGFSDEEVRGEGSTRTAGAGDGGLSALQQEFSYPVPRRRRKNEPIPEWKPSGRKYDRGPQLLDSAVDTDSAYTVREGEPDEATFYRTQKGSDYDHDLIRQIIRDQDAHYGPRKKNTLYKPSAL